MFDTRLEKNATFEDIVEYIRDNANAKINKKKCA